AERGDIPAKARCLQNACSKRPIPAPVGRTNLRPSSARRPRARLRSRSRSETPLSRPSATVTIVVVVGIWNVVLLAALAALLARRERRLRWITQSNGQQGVEGVGSGDEGWTARCVALAAWAPAPDRFGSRPP